MSSATAPTRDALDDKVNRLFAGKVVRKDLVRKVKVGANVPVFVLEFLLGKYCASSDEVAIQMGLQVVNDTLANNYIRADESMKAQAMVKDRGRHTFIDKVKVRLVDSDYWAEVTNFGHKNVHVPEHYVRDFERLVMGGVWSQVDMRFEYDEESKGKNPFWIDKLTPIQIATFDLEEYRRVRSELTTDEWLDLIMRSMGYEPNEMTRRLKLLFLVRLIPLAERNYNLVELGPRGTGKSYVVQEVSPYSALLTGGTTVANLFGHMNGRQKGMVQIWDVVGFDEVADLQKMPKEVITTMKTYCESGTFQRGQEAVSGDASIAMFGNTNQPVDVMVQTGHLFAPMPDIIRDDMAFIDRLHFYLPGWEIPKMRNEMFTSHYGFVVDYLAEALRDLRKHNFTEIIDRHFSLGAHLNARDRKAVRKTVSGLMKILFPHGEVTRDELGEILELAVEGRRRVKEQLKKMGSFEYYHTSFSYSDNDTGEEKFVGVPEQGGRDLISTEPLAPGTVYSAGVTSDGTVGLYRVEVSVSSGTGKLKLAGGVAGAMKESVQRAFSFLQTKKSELGLARDLDVSDLHVEVIDLLANRVEAELGVAFFIAAYSALRKAPVSPALLILGDLSVQGNIKPLRSLTEPLQVAKDNGAKRALIPIENKRNFLDVSADIMEHVDPIFYGDAKTAALKVLGMTRMEKLVLVHLSDIHFTRASGVSVHDLDKNVRNELVLDATKVAKEIGPVTGVLVTGDIAFSGTEFEFDHATNWLCDFCRAIGCHEESVWVVPGNHDVDRQKTKRKLTRMLHQGVRKDGSDVDKELREIFSDAQSAAALLEPLTDYNKFAARFGCSITAEKHYWERDLALACGTAVRLRGLTSALVSNDDDRRTGIVLGAAQATVERGPGVLHMTLCHHPPDWLRDHDAVEDHLKSKVHIQLFGHKHSQRLDEINGKVRLIAGAMHPERAEGGWLPAYNFLEISRRDSDRIGLRVYQRQWNQPDTNFVAWRDPNDGKDHREFFWSGFPAATKTEPHSVVSHEVSSADVTASAPSPVVATTATEKDDAMPPPNYERRLTYRFLTLPFRHQIAIAKNLDVLTDVDRALSDEALFRILFKRAAEEGLLGKLWAETEKLHDDPAEFNPFANSK